jgi:cytochrome b subunit of formate dehydrogenase
VDSSGEQKYLRMSFNERVQHFLLLTSFFTLVITGFALKFPESLWVRWFIELFGEHAFDLRGTIHRVAAAVMVGDSIYHIFYVSITRRGRQLVKDFWFKRKDASNLWQSLKYYLGKVKERPRYGRFSYIEKIEYWSMVWGTITMSVTGGVLWFENTFLPVISNSGMNIATTIHFYEAILATLAILVWHLYFVIYNPDVYPMNKAWFTGYLTREEMELEHPLELEEIEKSASAEKEQERELEEAEVPLQDEDKKKIELPKPVDKKEEIIESIKNEASQKTQASDAEKISENNTPTTELTKQKAEQEQTPGMSQPNKGGTTGKNYNQEELL